MPVEYYPEHAFRVFLDGNYAGEFVSAGPLFKAKVDMLKIQGGGGLVVESISPGKAEFEPLVLTQGVSDNTLLRDWFMMVVNAGGLTGELPINCRRVVRVDQLGRDMNPIESYTYPDALISEYDEGKFDAKSSEFRMRSVTIVHRIPQVTPAF
jgi:phage tail-like protein